MPAEQDPAKLIRSKTFAQSYKAVCSQSVEYQCLMTCWHVVARWNTKSCRVAWIGRIRLVSTVG